MHAKHRLSLTILLAFACGSSAEAVEMLPPATPPAGFSLDTKLTEEGSWQSNPLMLSQNAKSLWGSLTTVGLTLNNKTPTTLLQSETVLNQNIFDQSEFNSTDVHQALGLQKDMQRASFGLKAKLDYDTTRTSEITNFGLNLPSVRRTGLSATPEFAYKITPVEKISMSATALKNTYDNAAFTDYSLTSANTTYTRDFGPLDTGVLSFQAQRYSTLQGSRDSVDSFGPGIGWIRQINARLVTNFTAGLVFSKQDATVTTASSRQRNYTFSGGLTYKGEQDRLNITATRTRQPFGNGTETLLTSFDITNAHAINEALSLNLDANYRIAKQDQNVANVNLDNEAQAGIGFSYHLTPEFDLTTHYHYRTEKLTTIPGRIEDNSVLFGITYRPFAASL